VPLKPLVPLLLLLAACASYDPARAPVRSSDGVCAFAERCADLPMQNVAMLDEGFWRGSAPDAEGMRALRARGFRSVIDLRAGAYERRAAEDAGLRLVAIPLRADLTCDPPDAATVRRFLDAVTDPANRPAYVHCQYGRDRTGTMSALYRMEVSGWTLDQALEEMHAFGFRSWYADFVTFLNGYTCCGDYRAAAKPETAPSTSGD
jgi:protein tyrosine phosphatase (PTP) superfamily phosphohydrolase (DUF442 family)